jgi:hypothetical protein
MVRSNFKLHGKNMHTLVAQNLVLRCGKTDYIGPRPPCPNRPRIENQAEISSFEDSLSGTGHNRIYGVLRCLSSSKKLRLRKGKYYTFQSNGIVRAGG